MSLVKTVEMRILADAGDAQKKLDEMDAKAKDLDSKAIRMRFRLDSAEGKAQLDEIKAKADRLGYKDVEIKVRVDGKGRAVADLMALKAEADKAGGGGLLSKLGGLLGIGGAGGLSSAAGALPLVGGAGPGGLAAIAAGVAALLPEVVALASGFAAAGAGAGAFYVLAHPAISNLQQDYKSLQSAQQSYQLAQEKASLSPTKSNLNAEAAALLKLRAIRKGMTTDEFTAAGGISRLSQEYHKLTDAFKPQAFKIFADGLQVVSHLLPAVSPMASAFANALHPLLQQLGAFTQSSGFKEWLRQFTSLIGPAVTAIGKGIGGTVNEIGKLLTIFSGKDVANGINIAFGVIKGAIQGIIGLVRGLKAAWDGLSHTSTFRKLASDFRQAWDSISKAGGKKPDFSGLTSAIKDAANTAITWLSSKLPPLINGALKTASGWLSKNASTVLVPAGRAVMQGLISGIQSQIPSLLNVLGHVAAFIAEHKGPVEKDRAMLVPHGKAIMDGLMAGIHSRLPALEAQLHKITKLIADRIKTEVSFAKGVTASAMSGLGLTSIDLSQGTVATGMQSYLTSIKSFIADLKALSAQHLNKSLLRQLIAAGPVTGDLYAQSILTGGGAGQVNALYRQIQRQAQLLGAQAAQSVYGGKVTAGRNDTLDVKVDVRLTTQKQALALEIVKVLKEYKRHGGNVPLGIG